MDFLAHRRPVPHLFDLAPHMDPAAFQFDSGFAAGAPIYGTIRTKGERQTDVRLLVDDGERHLGLATALANNLRCDVYITPQGAYLRYVRESSPVAGGSWDAIAIDRTTEDPAAWLVVRPDGLPAPVPTWFSSVRGRLRPSHGVVTVALPDGLAFATKSTFRDTVFLAAAMRRGAGRVTTVAVNGDPGRFEISRFDDASSLLGGAEFATLVSASLDLIHPDVQLALTWPSDAAACAALDVELVRFADALNRTIWVPRPHGAAFLLPGCGEFAAVDEVGSPSTWQDYSSRLATTKPPLYRTDADGRLVPLGQTVVTAFPGVPFVSVPSAQLERLRPWYRSVARCADVFAIDLAVLADGRLGVLIEDRTPLAVGPRQLRELLRDAGWSGEDLLLLTQPPSQYWNEAMEHVRSLANQLMVDIWFPAFGADVWAQEDGTLAAAAPDGTGRAWRVVTFGRAVDLDDDMAHVATPAALTTAPRPPVGVHHPVTAKPGPVALARADRTHERPMPKPGANTANANTANANTASAAEQQTTTGPTMPDPTGTQPAMPDAARTQPAMAEPTAAMAEPTAAMAEPTAILPVVTEPRDQAPSAVRPAAAPPVGVPSPPSLGSGRAEPIGPPATARSHAVAWLPERPALNRRAIGLYLWTPQADDQVEAWELPSADLFLLAGQDPLLLAERQRDGYLLRVCAPEGAAIDVYEHIEQAPPAVRQRVLESGGTHLVPLARLSDLRVTARFDLDGRCGIAARTDIEAGALTIRFEGAEHGIPGLPNEVVHWPGRDQRSGVPSYLMLRDDTALDRVVHRGYVALSRRKPPLVAGHSLIEVKLRKRKAIDVPATLDNLGGLPPIGRLHDFVGLDLLLAETDLSHAAVSKIWRYGPNGKPVIDRPTGETLSNTLATDAVESRTAKAR